MTTDPSGNPDTSSQPPPASSRDSLVPVYKVAVVGEIPFAGSRVARALVRRGLAARVLCPGQGAERTVLDACAAGATASAGAAAGPGTAVGLGSVETVRGDVGSDNALAEALAGASGACFVTPVTMAGRAYRPRRHVEDVQRFVEAAQKSGVGKLVYHSALGAHAKAASRALQDAAAAEEAVRAARCKCYLARTGPLMGRGDGFLSEIVRSVTSRWPLAAVLGYGDTVVQPLHVDDMARCFARFLLDRPEDLEAGRYSLAGPDTATLLGLHDMAASRLGRRKLRFHAPLFVLRALAVFSREDAPDEGGLEPGACALCHGAAVPGPGLRPRRACLGERVNLLFDVFSAEHNDAPRLLGIGEELAKLRETQEEVLSAAAT